LIIPTLIIVAINFHAILHHSIYVCPYNLDVGIPRNVSVNAGKRLQLLK